MDQRDFLLMVKLQSDYHIRKLLAVNYEMCRAGRRLYES